jgi:hypothetical protein
LAEEVGLDEVGGGGEEWLFWGDEVWHGGGI